jgi:UDP-glucose 4-epimerase
MQYNKEKYELVPLSLQSLDPGKLELNGVHAIVHLAGKAHQMQAIDDQVYFDINYELAKKLADRAKQQGVSLFIYMSTVKVYGDATTDTLDEFSSCNPADAYGKSKLDAEKYLRSIESPQFRVAIIRPPMVYGPGVKGNMIRLLQLAEKNIPLPFAGIHNHRSIVFVDNLIALINQIVDKNARGVFIAGDARPLSTAELVGMMRQLMNKRERLVTIPSLGKQILKKMQPALYHRLFDSFVVSNLHSNESLQFVPPYSTEFGLRTMVNWWLGLKKQGKLGVPIK